ncbi:hypothetical protein GE061_016738 [Apolygus lucorum]|uniref:Tumor necrosis factor alpha-induced protein 8-like protein n=1 Tax=Apolygus lucorum TaxID=248454 RepID=A0A8S9XIA8_APOLU|nr:hypothetical protein GE061_016738 [Apolygus lucorum]
MTDVMSEGFKSRDIGLRAQKKILSRMANKNVAKMFIDDTTASLLDNLFRMAKQFTDNKKESEKLIKNIIKVVIKIGVLYRNEQFSAEEIRLAEKFKNKFHSAAMAVISFHEVEFSYDRAYLHKAMQDSHELLRQVVARHLTEKSLQRIDSVFNFFGNPQFLDAVFRPESPYKELLERLVSDISKAMDEGGM